MVNGSSRLGNSSPTASTMCVASRIGKSGPSAISGRPFQVERQPIGLRAPAHNAQSGGRERGTDIRLAVLEDAPGEQPAARPNFGQWLGQVDRQPQRRGWQDQ